MNTLLIGGNRFVGVEIAWKLLAAGHDLTVLALDSPPADLRPHIRWITVDRNDTAALKSALAGRHFDCVVDNIAYVPDHIRPTLAALPGKIGRYLLTGTTDVYPSNLPRTWREDEVEVRDYDLSQYHGHEHYNYGKRSCQALLQNEGVAWTVIRPCVVTGPRDNRTGAPHGRGLHWFEQGSRSHFWVSRLRDGAPILLSAADETRFNLVWVGDVANAMAHVLTREDTIGKAYNVLGDEIWTNERLLRGLAHAAGLDPEIVYVPGNLCEQAGIDYYPVYGTGAGWTLYENDALKATGWQPTPAETWLPRLLEADSEPELRAWYHTRLQEIALARYLQRGQTQTPAFAVPPALTFSAGERSGSRVAGASTAKAGLRWREQVLQQKDSVVPLASFYRQLASHALSGIGVGTWMGDLSAQTDQRYVETLVHAAARGLNVFDTAINYRHMKAERCVGQAVQRLAQLGIPREALFICSKGGYITHDAADPSNPDEYLRRNYLEPELIDASEMARNHSLSPAFIGQQIGQSLNNLGLATIDLYYLHNPEDELAHLGAERFYQQLGETFVVLEQAVRDGQIGCYGLATWHGTRVSESDPGHLSLQQAVRLAEEAAATVGHAAHHLRAVQLPYNVQAHQAYSLPTQRVGTQLMTPLAAAGALGLYCFTSASVLQGSAVPATASQLLPGCTPHTAALGAVIATPGVGTALVGMRSPARVEEAIALAAMTPLAVDLLESLLHA